MYEHKRQYIDPADGPVPVYDFRKDTAEVVQKYVNMHKQADGDVKEAISEHIAFLLRQDRE